MSSDTRKYYIKGEHYDWTRDPRGLENLFHMLRSRIFNNIRGNTILDVGCGTGLVTRQLSNVVGIDINRWNLLRSSLDCVQSDAERLPFMPASFDTAVCTEILEHLDNPEKVLREILRVLVPGGRLYGTTPHRHPLWLFRRFLSVTHPHSEPFHHNYSRRQLREMLKPFANVRIRYANFGMILVFTADN
jgi:ubiquinone/menaquinone biosynthesis C-methylase UbiE